MNTLAKLRLNYLLIPLFALITASAASYFADTGRQWYRTIHLPVWTPASTVMNAVWIIIFIFAAVSLLLIWNRKFNQMNFRLIIFQYIVNAVLIVSWNILFFTYRLIGVSFFLAVIIIANLLLLLMLIWPVNRLAAYLLIPYTIWVTFSTLLVLNVWMIN